MSTEQERYAITEILTAPPDFAEGMIESWWRPVIIELGAFCGEDSMWMREACGQRHALNVMVEPDRRNCAFIREHRRGIRTRIIEAAIASYTGMIGFNQGIDLRCDGQRSGSGSIRTPTLHSEMYPEINFRRDVPVPCWSLDHLVSSLCLTIPIDLLWVDIQGAERDMILGAQQTLDNTRYLFIEAETQELYDGMALRDELVAMLPQFKVIGEFEYNLLLEAKEQ